MDGIKTTEGIGFVVGDVPDCKNPILFITTDNGNTYVKLASFKGEDAADLFKSILDRIFPELM